MTFHTARILLSCSALTAAILTGCAKSDLPSPSANDYFRPDNEPRAVDNIFAVQRANAAREDGTLHAQHFTDWKLNGLGYAKLSDMTQDPNGLYVIYLDLPRGDTGYTADETARTNYVRYSHARDSVVKALARGGVKEEQYKLIDGPNPNVGGSAADSLDGLAKQKKDGGAGDAAPAAMSSAK